MSFQIYLTSFDQIKSFVAIAARQPFDIRVGNERQTINGKDVIGMVSLDFSRPLKVHANCDPDVFASFRQDALSLNA